MFHWQGEDFTVAGITLGALAAVGIKSDAKDYGEPNSRLAFLGGADEQNRDYGVEFHFQQDRIVQFYARHNWRSKVPCPFELSVRGKPRVKFPLSEQELTKAFGKPKSVTRTRGK